MLLPIRLPSITSRRCLTSYFQVKHRQRFALYVRLKLFGRTRTRYRPYAYQRHKIPLLWLQSTQIVATAMAIAGLFANECFLCRSL